MFRALKWMTPLLLSIGLMAFAAGCGGDDDDGDAVDGDTPVAEGSPSDGEGDGDSEAVEKAIRDVVAAWNAKDAETLIAAFTGTGLVASFGEGEETTVEEIKAGLPEFVGSEPIEIREQKNTQVDGDAATTEVEWQIGSGLENVKFSLVDDAGAWKIDGEEDLVVEIPDGVKKVTVELGDFAFGFDAGEVTEGTIAFEAKNIGEQDHEMVIFTAPADATIEDLTAQLLAGDENSPPPAGVEFVNALAPIEAGTTKNMVFVDPLDPGRYVMVCFFPDTTQGGEEGPPHVTLGMVSEFTVPGDGAGAGTTPEAAATP